MLERRLLIAFLIKSLVLVVFKILVRLSLVMLMVVQCRQGPGVNVRANKLIVEQLGCCRL